MLSMLAELAVATAVPLLVVVLFVRSFTKEEDKKC